MKNDKLDNLLDTMHEDLPFDEKNFVSVEAFKESFFAKAEALPKRRRFPLWMKSIAALFVLSATAWILYNVQSVPPPQDTVVPPVPVALSMKNSDEKGGHGAEKVTAPQTPSPTRLMMNTVSGGGFEANSFIPKDAVLADEESEEACDESANAVCTVSMTAQAPDAMATSLDAVAADAVAECESIAVPDAGQCAPAATVHKRLMLGGGMRKAAKDARVAYDCQGNTEAYSAVGESDFRETIQEPLSTFSSDVDAASYTLLQRFVRENKRLPPPESLRIEELVNAFKYHDPEPQNDAVVSLSSEIAPCPWAQDHWLARIGVQAKHVDISRLPNSNFVFLIDVSGSMGDDNKLPLVKRSLKLLLDSLRDNDRVAIVTYACGTDVVLPSTPARQRDAILSAIDALDAGGSTDGASGIQLAYEQAAANFITGGNNRVILATDGDFNVGQTSQAELSALIEDKRAGGVYLTVLGFGMGNYKDDTLEMLANKGNGNYGYINSILEAKRLLMTEFASTLWTVAKDVKLQVEFNPRKVSRYRLIGYENRRLANEDFANDKKDAGDMGAGHTVTALYELIPASDSAQTAVSETRYTQSQLTPQAHGNEFMTVSMRYKLPDSDTSRLLTGAIENVPVAWEKTTDDFRFSAAVAMFGQCVRNARNKGDGSYEKALKIARDAKGKDASGERADFIRLIEEVLLLPKK